MGIGMDVAVDAAAVAIGSPVATGEVFMVGGERESVIDIRCGERLGCLF